MEDLREKFRKDKQEGKEINVCDLTTAYLVEVLFEASPTDPATISAVAELVGACVKLIN